MDTITIAVNFSKRNLGGRVYDMTGSDFDTMKAAVKASGGQYISNRKYWLIGNVARAELAKQFTIKTHDFDVEILPASNGMKQYHAGYINSRFNGLPLFTVTRNDRQDLENVINGFIAAYKESDEAAEKYGEENLR